MNLWPDHQQHTYQDTRFDLHQDIHETERQKRCDSQTGPEAMQADHGAIDDQKLMNLCSHEDLNETECKKPVVESLSGPAAMQPVATDRDGLTLPLDSIQANRYSPDSLNGQFKMKQDKDLKSNLDSQEAKYHTNVSESLSGLQAVQKRCSK